MNELISEGEGGDFLGFREILDLKPEFKDIEKFIRTNFRL